MREINELKQNTAIWRYMDVARFLALISEKKMYFPSLPELDEPWEGYRSESDPIVSIEPELMKHVAPDYNRLALVSCWHENEGESVAMWKLYTSGREGVAIKTTVAHLGHFASTTREAKIGRVGYRDIDDSSHQSNALLFECGGAKGYGDVHPLERALFRKNRGFAHEQEVRAVIYADFFCAEHATAEVTNPLRGGCRSEDVRGKAIPVDPSLLIERIVVSPAFPAWAIGSLQKVVEASGVRARVESSRLLDRPCMDLEKTTSSLGGGNR